MELTGQQLRHFMRKAFRVRHWREARSHAEGLDPMFDQVVGPVGRQQISLLEKIEELVRPFRIGEAPVLRIRSGDRLDRLAGHALDRIRPQIEIGAAEARTGKQPDGLCALYHILK
jgi:hypothetical protein